MSFTIYYFRRKQGLWIPGLEKIEGKTFSAGGFTKLSADLHEQSLNESEMCDVDIVVEDKVCILLVCNVCLRFKLYI